MEKEMKISFPQETLTNIIEETYFSNGQNGKLTKELRFQVDPTKDDVLYTIIKDLPPMVIRGFNSNITEGTIKFLSEQIGDKIELIPISVYCVPDQISGKYSFY
jgi:hypothetical protein